MRNRVDLQRMESALKMVKNPLKQMSNGPGDEKKDDGLKPVPDTRNIFEKGYDYVTGGYSGATEQIGGKTVKYTDGKGNVYDKDKNIIK